MKSFFYIGIILIIVGILWSTVNYIFHIPAYRPEWFDMMTMLRFIELNLIFTTVGIIIIIYGYFKSVAKE